MFEISLPRLDVEDLTAWKRPDCCKTFSFPGQKPFQFQKPIMFDDRNNPKQPATTDTVKSCVGEESLGRRRILECEDKDQSPPCANVSTRQSSTRKWTESSTESRTSAEFVSLQENKVSEKKLSLGDSHFETNESTSTCDEDPSQGAPLSMKNLMKVVRTFSKRLPKNSKCRTAPKQAKEADVIVFKRPNVEREAKKTPTEVSHSLPPILDFQEIVGRDISLDNENRQCLRSTTFETSRPESTMRSSLSIGLGSTTESQQSSQTADERVRCSDCIQDLVSDDLQVFGSSDTTMIRNGRQMGKSRMSFGFLYNQLPEHETLHF